jgi:hypothetical protein
MAELNFGLINQNLPGEIANSVQRGREDAVREQMAKQQLLSSQQQTEKTGMEMEQFKRRQAGLDRFISVSAQNGKTGDPEQLARDFSEYAVSTGDANLIMTAQQAVMAAQERSRYNREQGFGTPAPAAAPLPAAASGAAFGASTPKEPSPGYYNNLINMGANPVAAPSSNRLAATVAPAPAASNTLAAQVQTPADIQRRIIYLKNSFPNGAANTEISLLTKELEEMQKGHVVGLGGSLVRGGKAVFTAPERQDTDLIRNYNAAVKQGFVGSIFDYERKIKEAGKPPPAPRPEAAPRTQQVTMRDGTLGIMNMDTGVITSALLNGAPVQGKPSAFAEKTAIQQKQLGVDIGRTITELEDAAKSGGLIEQSTGSGFGRLVDASAGFVGQATPGAIAIGKLAPIADMVLKMVPRFEGPQSDKDTASYKQAAGQLADASLPVAIRQAAATEIVRLMKARKAQFSSTAIEAGGGAPAAAPAANIDALLNKYK